MQKIHVSRNGKVEGPYSLETLQEKILSQELSSTDWVWWKGQKNWTSIKTLPGLQFPSDPLTPGQLDVAPEPQADEPRETERTQYSTGSQASSASSTTEETQKEPDSPEPEAHSPGITVPDFRVEHLLWITAGWYWLRALAFKAIPIHLVALFPILLLFSITLIIPNPFASLCSALLPAVVAPWSWIIMEQFRHHPVRMEELFGAYFRAPLPLISLGLVSQLPLLFLLFIGDQEKATQLIFFCSLLISFFLFYSMNLLVDKRVSLLDAITFSFQAVNFQFFPMLLYFFLLGAVTASGFILFKFLGLFTLMIAYTSTIFAYLWVFSRDSLPTPKRPQENQPANKQ